MSITYSMRKYSYTLLGLLYNALKKENDQVMGGMEEESCETLFFDKDSKILPITLESRTYLCRRAVGCQGLCKFALCESCVDSQDKKRSRKSRGSSNELDDDVCCHDVSNLVLSYQLYNSRPESIGTKKWFDSPNGCFQCKGMFLIGQKQGKTVNKPQNWEFPDLNDMESSVANHYLCHRNRVG